MEEAVVYLAMAAAVVVAVVMAIAYVLAGIYAAIAFVATAFFAAGDAIFGVRAAGGSPSLLWCLAGALLGAAWGWHSVMPIYGLRRWRPLMPLACVLLATGAAFLPTAEQRRAAAPPVETVVATPSPVPATAPAIPTVAGPGTIKVASSPSGLPIYFDGVATGQVTPYTFSRMSGEVVISVKAPNGAKKYVRLNIVAGQWQKTWLNLKDSAGD